MMKDKRTFTTVVALDTGDVTRLGALLGHVTTLVTVATLGDTIVGTIGGTMTGFTEYVSQVHDRRMEHLPAVEALVRALLPIRTLLGEVTLATAVTALGVGRSDTRVGAVSRTMTLLTTVPASVEVLARLRAVTDAMIQSLAVVALDLDRSLLGLLIDYHLAVDTAVALLCPVVSTVYIYWKDKLTLALVTERTKLILQSTSLLETLKVLLGSRSHAMKDPLGTTRTGRLVESPDELAILLTMRTDQALVVGDLDGQGVQVVVEVLVTESSLKLVESSKTGTSLDVLEHVLLEVVELASIVGLLHESPSLFLSAVLDVAHVELASIGTLRSTVTCKPISQDSFTIQKKQRITDLPRNSCDKPWQASRDTP
jgi:CBS domain-containing protein